MKFTRSDRGRITVDAFDPQIEVARELVQNADPRFLRYSEEEGLLTFVCANGIATYRASGPWTPAARDMQHATRVFTLALRSEAP